MREKIKLLWILLKKSTSKKYYRIIKEAVSLVLILSILLSFTLIFRHLQHTFTVLYAESNFDFIVKEFNEQQISEIENLPFVNTVFPVRILGGSIINKHGKISDPVSYYAVNSFEGREISYFNDKLIIKMDEKILENKDLNPIIIDYRTARDLKARVGDEVYISFGINETKVPFTVAAISETDAGTPPVLMLWRGEQQEIFMRDFGFDFYSIMFVKTDNIDLAREYFLNEYIPMQMIEDGFFSLEDKDEILSFNYEMLSEREILLEEIYWELQYTPPFILITSILGFLTYLIVLYREVNKKIIEREKDFSILYAMGMPKIYLVIFLLTDTAIVHIPILGAATLVVKYFVYDFFINSFMPWYLLKWYFLAALALQILAILINAMFSYLKMKKIDVTAQLAKE